jgi:hypothetical protein
MAGERTTNSMGIVAGEMALARSWDYCRSSANGRRRAEWLRHLDTIASLQLYCALVNARWACSWALTVSRSSISSSASTHDKYS